MVKNVLITCGGGLHGATLIKELKEISGIIIHVSDVYQENITKYFSDHYVLCPPVNQATEYRLFIKKYIVEKNIHFVIPATIYDLKSMADLAKELECKFAVSSNPLLDLLLNKKNTYEWLQENELPTFKTHAVDTLSEHLPLIGKNPFEWGGKGMKVILAKDDIDELSTHEQEQFVWTDYLTDFQELSIDFCISFDRSLSQPIIRERQRVSGGYAVIFTTIKPQDVPEIDAIAQQLMELIKNNGGMGIFNVQIIVKDNQHYISDINPRVGTSTVAGKYLNNNLCEFLINDRPSNYKPEQREIKVVRNLVEKIIKKPKDLSHIQGIIFDLDDTLIPHKKWIYTKLKNTLQHFIKKDNELSSCLEYGKMLIDEAKTDRLFDFFCEKFNKNDLKQEMIDWYRDFSPTSIEVYPDVLNTLEYLSGKYQLGILTDNPVKGQKQKIAVFPYHHYFQSTVYSQAISSNKPDSAVFDYARKSMNLPKKNLVMVGDNFHRDIKGALDYGFGFGVHLMRQDSIFNTDAGPDHNTDPAFESINSLSAIKTFL